MKGFFIVSENVNWLLFNIVIVIDEHIHELFVLIQKRFRVIAITKELFEWKSFVRQNSGMLKMLKWTSVTIC